MILYSLSKEEKKNRRQHKGIQGLGLGLGEVAKQQQQQPPTWQLLGPEGGVGDEGLGEGRVGGGGGGEGHADAHRSVARLAWERKTTRD